MRVRIHYMAQLKHAAGVGLEVVNVSQPCTVAELLQGLAAKYGDAFRSVVFDAHGRVQPAVLFFVGAEQVRPDAVQAFRDGDDVTVLAPMAGG